MPCHPHTHSRSHLTAPTWQDGRRSANIGFWNRQLAIQSSSVDAHEKKGRGRYPLTGTNILVPSVSPSFSRSHHMPIAPSALTLSRSHAPTLLHTPAPDTPTKLRIQEKSRLFLRPIAGIFKLFGEKRGWIGGDKRVYLHPVAPAVAVWSPALYPQPTGQPQPPVTSPRYCTCATDSQPAPPLPVAALPSTTSSSSSST